MKTTLILLGISTFGASLLGQTASVIANSATTLIELEDAATLVPAGSSASLTVGQFDANAFVAGNTLAGYNDAFTRFSPAAPGTDATISVSSMDDGTFTGSNIPTADATVGEPLAWFVFYDVDGSDDASIGDEFGVFSSTSPAWEAVISPGVNILNANAVDVFHVGSGAGSELQLVQIVPEPEVYAALAGLLALGSAIYRRRRS